MYPPVDPKLSVYSLGVPSVGSGSAIDVQPLHWIQALPGDLLGDDVKYFHGGKKRAYGRLAMALVALMLLAGLTANRYVASDALRASVVVSRVTGIEAIANLPAEELLTAACPCKNSVIQWRSVVSFTPSILAMSHAASKLSASKETSGNETFRTAQCNSMTITGRPEVVNASALNDTATVDMVWSDPCYSWAARSCANIFYNLRATLPLVEEEDNVTSASLAFAYLKLPMWKEEGQLRNIWLDYLNTESQKSGWAVQASTVAHNQGMEAFFRAQDSNSSLQASMPALKSFYQIMTEQQLSNSGDVKCDSDPADLNARGQKRIHAPIIETTTAFLQSNTVVNTKKARQICAPLFCDVMRRKTALHWVTEVLSTIGGLWTVIIGSVATVWALINLLSCMGAGYGSYKVWHP